jgi:5-methyltetrahydrofolate--homocysteine methyltransferase
MSNATVGLGSTQAPSLPLILLDGGMGHLLKDWGLRLPDLPHEQQFLAGVVANELNSDAIRRAHAAYLSAGANCITTNSFAATRHSLTKIERGNDAAVLVAAAARNAVAARDGAKGAVLVAGSLPPLQERCGS